MGSYSRAPNARLSRIWDEFGRAGACRGLGRAGVSVGRAGTSSLSIVTVAGQKTLAQRLGIVGRRFRKRCPPGATPRLWPGAVKKLSGGAMAVLNANERMSTTVCGSDCAVTYF